MAHGFSQPWRCLKRGFFLLMMYSLPFLRTILQSTLRFFTEALTFIFFQLLALSLSAWSLVARSSSLAALLFVS